MPQTVSTPIATDAYVPNPGGQALFHSCPVFECLAWGNRGSGKTLALLAEFAKHVGDGFGRAWRGILFRREFKDLQNVVNESLEWFPRIAPGGTFLRSPDAYKWQWETGEELLFRHAKVIEDYGTYHGSAYPWIAFEEISEWASPDLYLKLFTICRSATPGMPRRIRATTNPSGPGHSWLRARFIDAAEQGVIIREEGGRERCHIRLDLDDNAPLLKNDPYYKHTIRTAAGTDPNIIKAWLEGSWDITSGGMFDDLWVSRLHSVPAFEIPHSWRIDRSFDHGQSKPFSVGWWAESDGTGSCPVPHIRGTLFRIHEWYGSTGKPNEGLRITDEDIAKGIVERERMQPWGGRVRPGPADNAIFARDNNSACPADAMARFGVYWTRSDKRPGSRTRGWQMMRNMLSASVDYDQSPYGYRWFPETPGLFVFDHCRDFIRTVPPIARDKKDPDDVDSSVEDHIADETRYRVTAKALSASQTTTVGLY